MSIPKLLRTIADGTQAQESRHDVILNAAADRLEEAAAFLDRAARDLDSTGWVVLADECRAMAANLRGVVSDQPPTTDERPPRT